MEKLSGLLEGQLHRAARIIREGGTVVYPTETVYGIGADASSDKAVRRVFECKKREDAKAISILLPEVKCLRDYAIIPRTFNPEILLPGPVTLILALKQGNHRRHHNRISRLCVSEGGKAGFRVSSNPYASLLASLSGCAITSTSANISGSRAPSSHDEVSDELGADAIISAGPTVFGMHSTVFDVTRMRIVREGVFDAQSIMSRLSGKKR